MKQQRYKEAEADFDMAIRCDSNYLLSYFNRAIVYSSTNRPMQSLADFLTACCNSTLDNSLTYFNRAIVRSQIGDYNRRWKTTTKWPSTRRKTCSSTTTARAYRPSWGISKAPSRTTRKPSSFYPRFRQRLPQPQPSALSAQRRERFAPRPRHRTAQDRRIQDPPERQHLLDLRRHDAPLPTACCRSMPTSPAAPSDASPPRAPTTALRCCRSSASRSARPTASPPSRRDATTSQRRPISAAASTTGT